MTSAVPPVLCNWCHIMNVVIHVSTICAMWILRADGQQSGSLLPTQIYYTRIDELPGNVVVGNIVQDSSLHSKYPLDILDSFVLDIIGGEHLDYFHMDREHTGNLKTSKFIDRDVVCKNTEDCDITLDVAIVQPSDYFQVIQVTLTLLDINDNIPEFSKSEVTVHISENALPPVSFVLPTATDPDSPNYSIKSYSFTRRSSKFDLELIENSDGSQDLRLKLLERLNREIQSSYSLQVQALDGGQPAKVGLLDIQIIVLDANDNTPVFERDMYNVSVREDHPLASPFLKVKATDSDEGLNGQVLYSLSDQVQDTFSINSQTGELSLLERLDYEKQTSYHLLVTATDQGPDSVPVHVRVVVNVEDVNDCVPKISYNAWTESGQIEVMENEVRSFVAHISVTDEDTGLSGTVRCHVTDRRFTLEEMYRKRYKMMTTAMLDREEEDLITVNIKCQDQGIPSLSDSLQMTIHVLDENDNRPVFSKSLYTVSIAETSPVGYSVLTVSARDDDIGSNSEISYHLHANSINLLKIDSNNGVITTNSLLDYETINHLYFYVLAIDGGHPAFTATATVSMTITDVNDEKPIFGQPSYNFGTFENQLPGTEIGSVEATDSDAVPNDAFIFTLSDNSTFSIDPVSGLITTNKILDREHEAAYYLYVQATDIQPPYLSSTVSLTIYVADRNDNAPRISFPNDENNTVEISSFLSAGSVITNVLASDIDLGNNARLEYSFGKGNVDEMFTMDPLSGVITVQGDLSKSRQDRYKLLIIVKDHGESEGRKSAMATLNVVVNRTMGFAEASNITPQMDDKGFILLGFHEKILIIIGATTLVIVSLLIVAIICIKRRQTDQERDSYKYMCRVDMANMKKELDKRDSYSHENLSVLGFNSKLSLHKKSSSQSTLNTRHSSATDHSVADSDRVILSRRSSFSQPDISVHSSSPCLLHGTKLSVTTFRPSHDAIKVSESHKDESNSPNWESGSGVSADVTSSDSVLSNGDAIGNHSHSVDFKRSNSVCSPTTERPAPHLPPRSASLTKTKAHQIGCHGYRSGQINSGPRSAAVRNGQKYNILKRSPTARSATIDGIPEEGDDLMSAYSSDLQYNREDTKSETSHSRAINV